MTPISTQRLQQLAELDGHGARILSLYLDLDPHSAARRGHRVALNLPVIESRPPAAAAVHAGMTRITTYAEVDEILRSRDFVQARPAVGPFLTGTIGTLEQILHGPSTAPDGSMNLMGALKRTMATAGYTELKEFQRVEVVVTPPATHPR